MTTRIFLTAVFAAAASNGFAEDSKLKPQSVPFRYETETRYLIYKPKNYEEKQEWPLMLFLHGAGERGDNLEKVKIHGPPKLIAAGRDFPCVVISPQCPANRWWDSRELLALLDEVVASHSIDEDRIYVTGLSMGGYGTWRLAAAAPERFAAIVPVCGGGIPYLTRLHTHLPVWTFHGTEDRVVDIQSTQMMVDAIKSRGGTPNFTVYPGVGHDSWTRAYDTEELYEWLFNQQRDPKKPSN